MTKLIKLKILLSDKISEPVSDLLLGLGSEGVSEYIINNNTIELNSYFSTDTAIDEVIENIKNFITIVNSETTNKSKEEFCWEYIDRSSWDIWKSYLKMVKISNRIVIKPPWEKYKACNDEQQVIEINPSLAFGTGHHETTSICIKYIDEITESYKINSVLDVGSGSGILGICSVKLGVKSAVCIDNDFIAIKETVSNTKRNNIEMRVYAVNGLTFAINGKFDLIVSNIFADTLIGLKEEFKEKINDKGLIILSGIKEDEKERVIESYKTAGFNLISKKIEGGWAGLLFNINLN